MRLICPNCDAEYEVDASVIPEAGRDVQCSNCGHAWFQASPEVEAEKAAEAALFDPPMPDPSAPRPHSMAAQSTVIGAVATGVSMADTLMPELPKEPAPPPESPRRSMDESVLAVLREEAEREAAARQREDVAPLEARPDPGLAMAAEMPPAPPAVTPVVAPETDNDTALRRKIAALKGAELAVEPDPVPMPDPAPAPRVATRRDILPAVEEINSTLRSTSERSADEMAAVSAAAGTERAGFRSGFTLMLILAVILVLAYIMAPKLSEQMPAAAGVFTAYVAAVDALRLWIDGLMQSAITAMRGKGA